MIEIINLDDSVDIQETDTPNWREQQNLAIKDYKAIKLLKSYSLDHTPENKIVNQGFKIMEWNRVLENRS